MAALQQPGTSSDIQWNIPLDEIIDCTKCPEGCQTCYYKTKHAPVFIKIILVVIFLAVIIALVAFMFRFGIYHSKTYTMGAGDERLLDNQGENEDDFSRLLCKAVKVDTKSAQATSAYVFTSKPRYMDRTETYDIAESVTVSSQLFPSWGYHLNADGPSADRINVQSCSSNSLSFHFFSDKTDLHEFVTSKGSCTGCIYHTCNFYPCGSSQPTCQLTAPKTTTIYMALVSSVSVSETVDIYFHFRRSRFDLSEAISSCIQKPACSTNLPFSTKAIILTLPINATLNPSQLTTDCVANVGMYFAFFLGIPLGICAVFGMFALLLMKLQQSVMKDVEQADLQREYRQMGYRENSSHSAVTNSADSSRLDSSTTTDTRPLSPPPAYHISTSNHGNSGRASLVENEQPISGSLPDYDSVKETIANPPSYGSLNAYNAQVS
ncbi:uncharacterized protein [Amphiura filiformis]|uniref:uncharacterized protein n=1 Tax=Amphiura filiformis TaxID=82378 RepID=UPI003B2239DC